MSTQLDRLMPDPDHQERHTRHCRAPMAAVWDALHELTVDELLMAKVLTGIRGLATRRPAVDQGGPGEQEASAGPAEAAESRVGPPALEAFAPRVCLEDRPREIVLCDIATYASPVPRRPVGVPRGDLLSFVTFTDRGWTKVLMNFRLDPAPGGGTTISTETRICSTDRRTRLTFRFYWLAVRVGSGLVRHDILDATCRRAEQAAAETRTG